MLASSLQERCILLAKVENLHFLALGAALNCLHSGTRRFSRCWIAPPAIHRECVEQQAVCRGILHEVRRMLADGDTCGSTVQACTCGSRASAIEVSACTWSVALWMIRTNGT